MTRTLLAILPAIALASCGGETSPSAERPATASTNAASGASAEQADQSAPQAAATSAILASLGPEYAAANLTNGARQFRRCQSCHTLSDGGRHTVGPNLHGIIDAPAANAERFSYSSQLENADLTWDLETLSAWIENPRALVPGNRMSFVGLRDADDRRDVIAYIAVETRSD